MRRVGNLYYTQDFAEAVFRESIFSHARFRATASKFIRRSQEGGCQLTSLVPNTTALWWGRVLEDVFFAAPATSLRKDLLAECEANTEFDFLSVDATVKCTLSLLGQGNYRTSRELRQTFATPDDESIYKVLSVRGRTGAVLALEPLRSESGTFTHVAKHPRCLSIPAPLRPTFHQQCSHRTRKLHVCFQLCSLSAQVRIAPLR